MVLFLEHFDACEKRNRKDRKRKSQTDLGSFVTKTRRIRPSHSESPTTECPQRNAADRGSNTAAVEQMSTKTSLLQGNNHHRICKA